MIIHVEKLLDDGGLGEIDAILDDVPWIDGADGMRGDIKAVKRNRQADRAAAGDALAPAEPSAQDLRVAAQAQAQMVQARVELAELRLSEAEEGRAERAQSSEAAEPAVQGEDREASRPLPRSSAADLDLYRRTAESADSVPLIDLLG